MALQFNCPFCKASQVIPDQAQGQNYSCTYCGKVVKIAGPAPATTAIKPAVAMPPLARPVATPAAPGQLSRRRSNSNIVAYVVVAVSMLTMATGVTMAILFWPSREPAPLPPKALAKANNEKKKDDKDPKDPALSKKIDEASPPEIEPEDEPPPPVLARKMSEWHLDGATPKVRLEFTRLDPDASVKELKVVVWTGDVGAPKPASWRDRPVRKGDGPRWEVAVPFAEGRGTVEVPLPSLPKDKVYWLQPVLMDGAGRAQWLALEPWEPAAPPLERRPALLVHKTSARQRKAQISTETNATIETQQMLYRFKIDLQADLAETVLEAAENAKDIATLRVKFPRVQFDFAQNGIPAITGEAFEPIRTGLAKLTSNWRLEPGGTIQQSSVNLDAVDEDRRKLVGEFHQRITEALDLASLHLPNRELQALESWTHERRWNKASLNLTATYEGRRLHQKRQEGYVSLRGTLKGAGADKGSKVEGFALVDLTNGFVAKVELKFEADVAIPFIDQGDFKARGVIEAKLTREAEK